MVYIVFPSMEEAGRVSNLVLEKRLCACTNIYPDVRSSFWWENKIEQCVEVAMFAKTSAEKLDELIAAVADAHSYECPCIVATPIANGNEAFLKWIEDTINTPSISTA